MKVSNCGLSVWVLLCCAASVFGADELVMQASKDTFGRSNERIRNNGASPALYIAHAANIRSVVAFDLSGVTNRVLTARLRFQQGNTMPKKVALTVAPMVQTDKNAAWGEGAGALGTSGQNARPGEACFGFSAFPDVQWESSPGSSVTDLGDAKLWVAPIVSRQEFSWEEGKWIEVDVADLRVLEEIRTSRTPLISFGLWGTSGNGLYAISSKESGNGPELVLVQEKQGQGGNNEIIQGDKTGRN